MDEAVVRIVLDSTGGGASPAKSTTPPPIPAPPAPTQLKPAAQPRSEPIPVKSVDPPKPPPPPAAPAESPKPPVDWMKSLISPTEGANPHVLLEGQSGSGKSLAAKHIAFERMRQGQDVNVVDTHTPEAWGGAKNVFQGATAGTEAADFLRKELESRKEQKSASLAKGEQPDFKPMTVVFSDFARLMKDTPQLGVEFATLLTEARKFRISVVADTTALTGAASGIKGIQDVLQNFGQKVKFYAPTAQGDVRKAEVAGEMYETPKLPEYKERVDYGLIKPPAPPAPPEVEAPFDPQEVAYQRYLKEQKKKQAESAYEELYAEPKEEEPPPPPKVFDPNEEARERYKREQRKKQIDAAYKENYGSDEKPKSGLDSLLKAMEPMRGAMGGMFGGMAGIALDTTAAARKQASDVGDGDSGIGKAALALGGVALAGTAVVKTFSLLDGEVQKSISRYADYSPAIAAAQAQAEVVTMLADIRRAQEHGPEIARYIQAQTEMQNNWEEVKMKFLEAAMPIMAAMMKALSGILTIGNWFRSREDENEVNDLFNFNPFTISTDGIGGAATPGGPQANNIFGS